MPANLHTCLERALARRAEASLVVEGGVATAYRLVNGEGDGVPGWAVDVYGRHLVAQSYLDEPDAEPAMLDALAALPFGGVYLKRRPRQANVVDEQEREARTPAHAVRGEDAPEVLVIEEHRVKLEVRLGDGFSTGLFLDQRAHRKRLRELGCGRVLNLFAYTCGFGVAAALGGAETVNVDLAKRALEWGKRNYALNGLSPDEHRFYSRDAFDFLARAGNKGERFDAVVLDPPSYARGRKARFNAGRDYVSLAAQALAMVAPGGVLLACTNLQTLSPREFVGNLQKAAQQAGVSLRGPLAVEPLGPDFPLEQGALPHLKAVWVGVR